MFSVTKKRSMQKDIFVIAEISKNRLGPVTYELIACAEELADLHSAGIKVIVISDAPKDQAAELAEKTGLQIIAVTVPELKMYNSATYKKILVKIIQAYCPLFICIAHTPQGLDFAPGLAVRLDCACITGVNGIVKNHLSRSICEGKINALIKPETGTTIITISFGNFKYTEKTTPPGTIEEIRVDETPSGVKSLGIVKSGSEQSKLSEAKIIIAVGRGIEKPENIASAKSFAKNFTDAAIACSRPLVDMGWMAYKHQVGITGAMVSPEIYFACGISGSSQHIAGMKGSNFVIAVNSDPNAAIFNGSDICIVDKLSDFFTSFEKLLKNEN